MIFFSKFLNVSKTFFDLLVFRILYIFSTFIFLSFCSKQLNNSDFGFITLALILINFSSICINFGFHELTLLRLNSLNEKLNKDRFLSSIIINKIIISIICIFFCCWYLNYIESFSVNVLIPIACFFFGSSLLSVAYFLYYEKTRLLMLSQVISKTLFILFLAFMFDKISSKEIFLLIFCLSEFFLGILCLLFMFKNNFNLLLRNLSILESFKEGLPYFVNIAGATLYVDIPAILVGTKFSLSEISTFNIASKIVKSLENLGFPILNLYLKTFLKSKFSLVIFKKYLYFTIFISIFLALFIVLISESLITIFFGEKYIIIKQYILILSPNIIFALLGGLAVYTLIAKERIRTVVKITWIVGIVSLIFIYVATFFSIKIVAFVITTSQLSIMIILFYNLYKKLYEKKYL